MIELHLGDCLEVMKDIPNGSIDAVVTDPPYFLPAQHYQTRKMFRKNFSDLGILEYFFRNFFVEMARVLKDTGAFYIFCDGQSYPLFWYYGFPIAKSVRPLIWDKQVSINGYHWRHQHELILFGEMPACKPYPTGDGDILRFRAVPVDDREHPAEKPVELLERLIVKCGDVVLDPFMGSGAIGEACIRTEHEFIGIEKEPAYYAIAERRIQEAQQQMVMHL